MPENQHFTTNFKPITEGGTSTVGIFTSFTTVKTAKNLQLLLCNREYKISLKMTFKTKNGV